MQRKVMAVALAVVLMFSVSGCGSGSGDSALSFFGDDAAKRTFSIGSLTLAWDAPVNSDGTPLANVAGYKVHYGTTSGAYDTTFDNGAQTNCTINGLSRGTYYVAVTCYDASGNESSFSNEVRKYIK